MTQRYTGSVRLLDDGKHEAHYLSEDNNPAIITSETFKLVQLEKLRRSNVAKGKMLMKGKLQNTVQRAK